MKFVTDNVKPILAFIVVILAFTYFFAVLIIERKVNDQVLIAIVGTLGLATGYYWGASSGSAKKDETISTLAGNQTSSVIENSENTTVNK